jgi:FKBP-type peptidyl-prolyl cis-trans isomerase 2
MPATGRDTDHMDFNVTNDRGMCVLHLQYDKTYRVTIQVVDHESVMFDFNVHERPDLHYLA